MAKPDQLLQAGGLLPVKAKVKDSSGVDAVSARTYAHPALAHRVVRLSADNLAQGEDLTMEFLGFEAPEVRGPVGKRRRQALGFPEWALVNDPKHARYALALVKEYKKEARRARSKPGHAYEAFSGIGKRLGKSVAHFLPSFWEQVGREYIRAGNATYASRAFGRAREAERVHSLKVDEQVRRDAFLEFALAGCVSAKALTEYGKDLQSAHEPAQAWNFMRDLCIRRTLGGMPPWTNMCKDLAALVKSAGLNVDEQIQSVLAAVLDSPAISRAAMGFWKGAAKYLKKLVQTDARIAGLLLNLVPNTSSWSNADIWPWLDYLDSWGILKNAWLEGLPEESQPAGGPAAWLSKVLTTDRAPRHRVHALLEQMADRLKKDSAPLVIVKQNSWSNTGSADVDFVDLALHLKVPVADPEVPVTFDLNQWAKLPSEDPTAKGRPRDPVALAADDRFRQPLLDAVADVAGESLFEQAATGKVALQATRREWVMNQLAEASEGGLPQTENSLAIIDKRTSAETYQEFPEAYQKLKSIQLLPALTRTINGGLFDEYGWPKLEEVVERFTTKFTARLEKIKGKNCSIYGSFPYAIVTDGLNAVVVKGEETVFEAELKLPKGTTVAGLHFLDGDLLVEVKKNYQGHRFWNSKPKTQHDCWIHHDQALDGAVQDMPVGGTFAGGRVMFGGEKKDLEVAVGDRWFGDGEHFFKIYWGENAQILREVDPLTGKEGRRSMPSFFEDFLSDKTELVLEDLSLHHFGAIVDDSPLGSVAGTVGFRSRRAKSGRTESEGIDGRSISSDRITSFVGLLNQPGTDKHLPLEKNGYRYRNRSLTIKDPTHTFTIAELSGRVGAYNRGQVTGFPEVFLHALKLRDPATSKQLRKLTDKQVQTLVTAEQKDFDAWGSKSGLPTEGADYPSLDQAIRKLLPKLTSDRLHVGLRALIVRFGRKHRQLNFLVQKRDPTRQKKKTEVVVSGAEATIVPVLRRFGRSYRQPARSVLEATAETVAFLRGEVDQINVPAAVCILLQFVTENLPRKAWTLYWTAEQEADADWLVFMEAIAKTGVLDLEGHFRFYGTRFTGDLPFEAPQSDSGEELDLRDHAVSLVKDNSRFLFRKDVYSLQVMEYAPTKKFTAFAGTMQPTKEVSCQPTWSSDRLQKFVELAKTQKRKLPDRTLIENLATRMNLSKAEVALIWLGYPNMHSSMANFMPKDLREGMKLKTSEVSSAKGALMALSAELRERLIETILDGPPEQFWDDHEQMAARLSDVWEQQKPNRLELPMELVEKFTATFAYQQNSKKTLVALNEPESSSAFSATPSYRLTQKDSRAVVVHDATEDAFETNLLNSAALCIVWLNYELPVGDASRKKMISVHTALLKVLHNPGLLLDAGSGYFYEGDDVEAAGKALEAAMGKSKKVKDLSLVDNGVLVASAGGWLITRAFRPAKLKKTRDYEDLRHLLTVTSGSDSDSEDHNTPLAAVELVRSDDFQAVTDRILKTPVPVGGFEANPLMSCPETVASVQKKTKLSENAAIYYLQLLALHDPTDKNIKRWNDWTAAIIRKAGEELVAGRHVMEAKRARAGRKFFLPGGWEALKSPHLPIETWKMSMFRMTRDRNGHAIPPLARIFPLEPVHQLFARAWKRVTSGDEPRYEEVG